MTTKMLGWWSGRMVYMLKNTEIITIKLKQFQKNILQNEIRIHICSLPAGNVNVSHILDYYQMAQAYTRQLTARRSKAGWGVYLEGGHISESIHHRPQVLYSFGILGSRPTTYCIQITIWAPHGPPDGGPPYGLALQLYFKGVRSKWS